jgi:hypothetical protein
MRSIAVWLLFLAACGDNVQRPDGGGIATPDGAAGGIDAGPGGPDGGAPADAAPGSPDAGVADAAPQPVACGPDGLVCDRTTQVCRGNRAHLLTYECVPVPDGCQDNRGCACVGAELCVDPFTICSMDPPADDTIYCDCPVC